MKALIDSVSTLVVAVTSKPFEVDTAHFWVDCGPDITVGNYTYANGVFTKVPEIPYIPTSEENVAMAQRILLETDWMAQDSIGDPAKSNPYITNQDEIYAYRNAVRQIALAAPSGNVFWPASVKPIWSNHE